MGLASRFADEHEIGDAIGAGLQAERHFERLARLQWLSGRLVAAEQHRDREVVGIGQLNDHGCAPPPVLVLDEFAELPVLVAEPPVPLTVLLPPAPPDPPVPCTSMRSEE